ncbi:MAG TPA: cytochrome c [Myxococcaceae bacterium]|nr:cytochrome c [Myxococcaceae bacterium]
MKKVLKIIAIAVAVLLLIPAIGLVVLALKPPDSRPASTEKVEATPERLARGAYLVEHVSACVGCHSERDEGSYAMPIIPGTEGNGGRCYDGSDRVPGQVCAANLTADPTGLAPWSDGELIRAMREGVGRDGHALFPIMPYGAYRHMSDEDARAIVAYLRTLAPISRARPATRLDFPLNLLIKFWPKPVDGPVVAPPTTDRVAYGRYLVQLAACGDCHSQNGDGGNPIPELELAGGSQFPIPAGRVVSSNLTPDKETGLGEMTRESFIGIFKSYASMDPKTPAAPGRNTVMPWRSYAGMTEEDLGAIYDYLRTVKPVKNQVNPFPDAKG